MRTEAHRYWKRMHLDLWISARTTTSAPDYARNHAHPSQRAYSFPSTLVKQTTMGVASPLLPGNLAAFLAYFRKCV